MLITIDPFVRPAEDRIIARQEFTAAVKRFTPREAQAVWYVLSCGTFIAAAKMLECTANAVRKRWNRALDKIRGGEKNI